MPGIDPYGGFTIPDRLHVDALSFDGELLTISGSVRGSEAHCPVCDQTSRRVHSHYTRTLADLPWSGTPVRLRVRVRKFFCDEPACERRIFAERLGGVARVRARTTERQREALEWIAFALGGEAGARLARDRSNVCREGANAGAPDALQVADRWHLLRSLALGLEEFLLRKRSALEGAAASERGEEEEEPLPGSIDDDVSTLPVRLGRPYRSIEGPAQKRHERLLERWKHVRRLHFAGASAKDIAERVGTSRSTVYRYRELAEAPSRPRYSRRASVLDPYLPYLLERWNEGCRSAKRLHAEIRERGYRHSIDTVRTGCSPAFATRSNKARSLPTPRGPRGAASRAPPRPPRTWLRCSCAAKRCSTGSRRRTCRSCVPRMRPWPTRAG
jgi:transposase